MEGLNVLMISNLSHVQITDLVRQGHYQLACGRYFEAKHKSELKFAPQHPNQYYDESRRLLAEDREGKAIYVSVFISALLKKYVTCYL